MGVIRVLPDEQIEVLIRRAIVGRIACCDHGYESGCKRPYLVPLAYGYDGVAIYAHSGEGRKIRLMRAEPLVTFEVDEAEAPDRWRSVIADGRYEELTEPADQDKAMRIIYPAPAVLPGLAPGTIYFCIVLETKHGRFELPE